MMTTPAGAERHVVKKSKFIEELIAFALKQAELGTSVGEVCRKMDRASSCPPELQQAN